MATDIIARGMASKAAKAAQEALDELAQVVEGTMNAAEDTFTDLHGNIVTPDTSTIYLDTNTYTYYRWNGSAYYTIVDPRDNVKFSPQTLTDEQKAQARQNIGVNDSAFKPFNPIWPTSGTVLELMTAINADTAALPGVAYLGEVTCSDLPFSGNAELSIYIMDGTATNKTIFCQITSGNIYPYHWEATYWANHISDWRAFAPVNVCRTGIKTLSVGAWDNLIYELLISGLTVNDYVHIIGETANDSNAIISCGIDYTLQNGKIVFTATTAPAADISLKIAVITGAAL